MKSKYYNRRTKDKHFNVGEKLLVLAPDSSNKIYSRWHGPCTITQVCAPYSYVVNKGDGLRRHLHANRIQKFSVRTHLIGIIKDDDDEFGEVPLGPTSKYKPLCLPSQKIDLRHLQANRIRKFIVRTHLIGIIKDDDDEFEEVPLGPTGKNEPLCLSMAESEDRHRMLATPRQCAAY